MTMGDHEKDNRGTVGSPAAIGRGRGEFYEVTAESRIHRGRGRGGGRLCDSISTFTLLLNGRSLVEVD